jgi:hypothetical protein
MTDRPHSQTYGNREDRHATRADYRKIFEENLNDLYQLSFRVVRAGLRRSLDRAV